MAYGSVTQKDALRQLLKDRYAIGAQFSLSEVYRHAVPLLEGMSSSNDDLRPSIRKYLQNLRDEEMLAFVDRGKYRRIS